MEAREKMASLNAMKMLIEVLQETGQALPKDSLHAGSEGRYERGKKLLARIALEQERILKETYDRIDPDIVRYVIAFVYGDIYAWAFSPCGTDRWRPLQRLRQKRRPHLSSGFI